MSLEPIFYTADRSRLRAGWRLAVHTALLIALASCLFIPLFTILIVFDPSLLRSLLQLKPEYLLLATIGETVAVTLSVFLARRFLDKRSIESLGLTLNAQAVFDILAGIGITFVQMGLIYVLMLGLGWLTFQGFAWEFDSLRLVITGTLIFFAIFIMVGWNEELLSRGYHLQTIASGLNLFWGVMISSAVFSLLHLANVGVSWGSVVGIFLAGIYLAFGYLRTRQLWLSIGLHIGWNFFEGVVFGFPVSGLDVYALVRIEIDGPEIWTGGAFGPEAGLIVLPALALGALLIYLYTRQRSVPGTSAIKDY